MCVCVCVYVCVCVNIVVVFCTCVCLYNCLCVSVVLVCLCVWCVQHNHVCLGGIHYNNMGYVVGKCVSVSLFLCLYMVASVCLDSDSGIS